MHRAALRKRMDMVSARQMTGWTRCKRKTFWSTRRFGLVSGRGGVHHGEYTGRRMVLPPAGDEHRDKTKFFQILQSLSQATPNPKSLRSIRRNETLRERHATARAFLCFVSGSSDPRVRHEEGRALFVANPTIVLNNVETTNPETE